MRRAQKRDAVKTQEFYFRKSLVPEDEDDGPSGSIPQQTTSHEHQTTSHDHEYTLMTVDTIINGKVRRVTKQGLLL